MVNQRKVGWTTISIPIHMKKMLEEYGKKGESWEDVFTRMLQEINEYRLMKERYKLR